MYVWLWVGERKLTVTTTERCAVISRNRKRKTLTIEFTNGNRARVLRQEVKRVG